MIIHRRDMRPKIAGLLAKLMKLPNPFDNIANDETI
ncbi:hypothetical protein GASC598P17_004850 [Gilliamella apis SCGC AB-598-P17]|nr:hypothetical protein GASC598P17_004850 [Gilliamella apis SCGC AB-598-P17]